MNGDEVVLDDGVYAGPGNVEIDFGGRSITLRSANGAASCTIDRTNVTAFRFDDGETAATRVVDLTLTGDTQNDNDAVQCVNASPTFEDCVFMDIDSSSAATIISEDGSSPTFTRCRFEHCSTGLNNSGGAIRHLGTGTLKVTECAFVSNYTGYVKPFSGGGAINATNLVVTDSTFTSNGVNGDGGAVFCDGSLTITDCTFENNTAQYDGGAVRARGTDEVTIERSSFISNSAMHSFVGEFENRVSGGAVSTTSPLTVRDCTFTNNEARGNGLSPGAHGGAIFADGATTQIEQCTVTGNRATTNPGMPGLGQRGNGGAVSTGGGTATFVACDFTGNLARGGDSSVFGGGAVRGLGPIELVSCRLLANRVESDSAAPAAGASVFGAQVTMTNCLSAQSLGPACGDEAAAAAICGSDVTLQNCTIVEPYTCYAMRSTGTASIVNSIVRSAGAPALDVLGATDVSFSNVTGVASGAGNIDVYPAFVNPGSGDYRLLALSAGVDVGDGTLLPADAFDLDGDLDTLEPLPVDLDGAPRIAGDDCVTDGVGGPLDMGASEHPNFLGPCDCNGNTIDDATDISGGASLDCNGNGVPDACDIAGETSSDCDDNGVPNECEDDCNGNGVADVCEGTGTSIGAAYDDTGADCVVTTDDLTLPAATFNALTASGTATLQLIPSSDVSSGKCVSTWLQVDVTYEAGGGCFGDFDGSGGIGFADLTTLLNAWGPCGACCPADIDGSGSVGFGDLTQLLNGWGPC